MKILYARMYANAILNAATKAAGEGRDSITEADVNHYLHAQLTGADDAARAELQAEIDALSKD